MPIAILLDSGFLYAVYNARDENHPLALQILQEIEENKFGTGYLTDYLFDETMTLFFARVGIEKAVVAGKVLLNSYDVIDVSRLLFQESWQLFQKHTISFTDCTVLTVMKHFNIEYLATFDGNFKGLVKTVGV